MPFPVEIIKKLCRANNTELCQKSSHLELFNLRAKAKFAKQKMDRFDNTIFKLFRPKQKNSDKSTNGENIQSYYVKKMINISTT